MIQSGEAQKLRLLRLPMATLPRGDFSPEAGTSLWICITGAPGMNPEIQQDQAIAYVIDDDAGLRDGVSNLLRSVDIAVEQFGSTKEFLDRERPNVPGCLVLDVRLPGMSGLEFQAELDGLELIFR